MRKRERHTGDQRWCKSEEDSAGERGTRGPRYTIEYQPAGWQGSREQSPVRRGTPRGLSSFVRSSIRVSICPSSPFRLNLSWSCVRSFVRPVRVWCVSLRLLSTALATGRDYRLCVKVHLSLAPSLSPRFSWRAQLKRQDGCRFRNGDVSLPGDCRLQETAA